jgi:hypothetical protein
MYQLSLNALMGDCSWLGGGVLLNNLLGGFLEHPPVYQKHLEISQFMNVNLLNRVPEQALVPGTL